MWWDEALNTNKMSEKDTNKQLSRREHGDRRVNWEVGEHRCNVEFVLSYHIALTTENQFNLFAFFAVSGELALRAVTGRASPHPRNVCFKKPKYFLKD